MSHVILMTPNPRESEKNQTYPNKPNSYVDATVQLCWLLFIWRKERQVLTLTYCHSRLVGYFLRLHPCLTQLRSLLLCRLLVEMGQ